MYKRNAPHSFTIVTVGLILCSHFAIIVYCATKHSPTMLEPSFVASGLSHWELGSFELYRVNPPLPRMLATIPAMLIGYKMDWSDLPGPQFARLEFKKGNDLIKHNGLASMRLIVACRVANSTFSIVGALVCFFWSKEVWKSTTAGYVSLLLWCFDPTVLAHAELVTTDCPSASLGVAASYVFFRWLRSATWKRTAVCGAVLGLALLTKSAWLILFPLWPTIWLGYTFVSKRHVQELPWRKITRELVMLCVILSISVVVLNAGYCFSGSLTRLGDFVFLSQSFSGQLESGTPGNQFSGSVWGGVPVPFPRCYIEGIDLQKLDFESWTAPSYLCQHWSGDGWWYYYLYSMLVKLPVSTLVLFFWIAILAGRTLFGSLSAGCGGMITLLPVMPAVALFLLASSQCRLSENFRYVLPSVAHMFVMSGGLCIQGRQRYRVILYACVLASTVSGILAVPHCLSYFNSFAGGPENGHRHLVGSSLGWGQDYLFLWERIREDRKFSEIYLFSGDCMFPLDELGLPVQDLTELTEWPHLPANSVIAVDVATLQSVGFLASVSGRQVTDARIVAIVERATLIERVGFTIYILRLK